jgi:hypothetical protein
MLIGFQRTTWNYVPKDRTLHNHYCENPESYINLNVYQLGSSEELPQKIIMNRDFRAVSLMFGGCDYEPLLLQTSYRIKKVLHPTQARSLSSGITTAMWQVAKSKVSRQ